MPLICASFYCTILISCNIFISVYIYFISFRDSCLSANDTWQHEECTPILSVRFPPPPTHRHLTRIRSVLLPSFPLPSSNTTEGERKCFCCCSVLVMTTFLCNHVCVYVESRVNTTLVVYSTCTPWPGISSVDKDTPPDVCDFIHPFILKREKCTR